MKRQVAIGIAVGLTNLVLIVACIGGLLTEGFPDPSYAALTQAVSATLIDILGMPIYIPASRYLGTLMAAQFSLMALNSAIWGALAFWLLRRRARMRIGASSR